MQTPNQPGNCSPPPGMYGMVCRSGAIISLLLVQARLLLSWTSVTEAVGNMKLFNNHSGSRGLPRFIKGIYWATGLFLRTPFTEGCAGANKKASLPGRQQHCTFRPTPFSSVQF